MDENQSINYIIGTFPYFECWIEHIQDYNTRYIVHRVEPNVKKSWPITKMIDYTAFKELEKQNKKLQERIDQLEHELEKAYNGTF